MHDETPAPGLPQVPNFSHPTLHLGIDDLPFVDLGNGIELQLLHVDLRQGLWINRTRLAPGTVVPTHYHAGPVFAVTLEGQWFYRKSPAQMNSRGSYLFEPPGSIHTLTVPADQQGKTLAWFAIYGPNINLAADGKVETILDAATMLGIYRALCGVQHPRRPLDALVEA